MLSAEDWKRRAREKEQAANLLASDKKTAREAFIAAGSAIEFAVKYVIHKNERFNRWPDAKSRPDLHIHNLRPLIKSAGIDVSNFDPDLQRKFSVVCNWSRGHDYEGRRMPRRVMRDMMDSAFGDDGVLEWLLKQ